MRYTPINIYSKFFLISFLIVNLSTLSFSQSSIRKDFTLGISKDILEDVNYRDAEVTLRIWGKILVGQLGENIESLDITIYDDINKLIEDTNKNLVDVMYISSLMFAKYEDKLKLVPLVSTYSQDKKFYDIVLCKHESNNATTFSDMKGSSILVQGGKYKDINDLWLNVLCLQEGIEKKEDFFEKIEFVNKPIQAVLPTFLKKTDYCIVNSTSLEVISEMNPQISKSIVSLFEKKNLPNDIICVGTNTTKKERALIVEIALNSEKLPKNKQIFKIFKTIGAKRFLDSDLIEIKNMIQDYQSLMTK